MKARTFSLGVAQGSTVSHLMLGADIFSCANRNGQLVAGQILNYVTAVRLSRHIKKLALTVVFASIGAAAANAAGLTHKEKIVCPSLGACIDIIRRHDASGFDYEVLAIEFQRFGPAGRKALMGVLDSEAGNPDIARLISSAGFLSSIERANLKRNWSLDHAEMYLPLLLDGHPQSRDLLLLTLGSDNPEVREQARIALLKLPQPIKQQPVSNTLLEPLLRALSLDPIAEAAPYISRLNPEGYDEAFSKLLRSGDPALVLASYQSLFRTNPSTALNTLLSEMDRLTSSEQSQAVGDMLLARHEKRADGFYLKFANDISGDQTRTVPARAGGMHTALISGQSAMPVFTPARAEALRFLVSGHPVLTQDKYLPHLKRLKAENELNTIWKIANEEKWVNRDLIAAAFGGLRSYEQVISDLIRADDFRTFSAGAEHAKPNHEALLRSKINHPIKEIRDLARKKLKLSRAKSNAIGCIISKFDSNDKMNQMPFFELAWMKADDNARVVLERKYLTAAHPAKTGWLAGYDLEKPGLKSSHNGAAVVYFDNKTGSSKQVGKFSKPLAILPDRLIKLGESTNRFWVMDFGGSDSADVSVYSVELTVGNPEIKHLGAVPQTAQDFSVAPNGDLLMSFKGNKQAPIRMSQRGEISLACRPLKPSIANPAPN